MYRITERDGVVIALEQVSGGGSTSLRSAEQWTITAVLARAAITGKTGRVWIDAAEDWSSITVTIDALPNAVDDESTFTASEITSD